MPTSFSHQIPFIMDVVTSLNPKRIIDVGTGCGKYGLLCREYLEFSGEDSTCPPPWKTQIDGIEGFAKYVQEYHHHIYDHLFVGDALHLLSEVPEHTYDMSLLIDVLEHSERAKGQELLEALLRISTFVVVSIPASFIPQDAVYGNQLEIHRAHWTKTNLRGIAPVVVVSRYPSLITVMSLSPRALDAIRKQFRWQHRIYQALQSRAARIPFVRSVYRALFARS
jgi:hypothetical protein